MTFSQLPMELRRVSRYLVQGGQVSDSRWRSRTPILDCGSVEGEPCYAATGAGRR